MGEKLMAKKESIHDFIYFQYKPLCIKEFIETMMFLVIVCVGAFFLNRGRWLAVFSAVFGGVCLMICIVSYVTLPDAPSRRFVIDGVGLSCMAIILNLGASQIIGSGSNIIISVFFLFLLVLSAAMLGLIIILSLWKEKYSNMPSHTIILSPVLFAIVGRIFAKAIFSHISYDTGELVFGYILLFLSLICNVGMGFFLKLYYYCKVEKKNTD